MVPPAEDSPGWSADGDALPDMASGIQLAPHEEEFMSGTVASRRRTRRGEAAANAEGEKEEEGKEEEGNEALPLVRKLERDTAWLQFEIDRGSYSTASAPHGDDSTLFVVPLLLTVIEVRPAANAP